MKIWRRRTGGKDGGDDAARDLDAARIRFFASIVNELRTPLSVILGQIDTAMSEDDPESRRRQLRDAWQHARRLERLASQAMDLTRLESGDLQADLRDVELVPFIDALVMSFEDLADRKGVILEFLARRASIHGRIDPDHLSTIVANLMSNAIKFTPSGGRIGVVLEFAPPDRMQLAVIDSGIGIAKERQAGVFDPLVRHPPDEAGERQGAGIGLALARQLARLHGGDISLRSESGKGCRFDVSIPIGMPVETGREELTFAGAGRPDVTAEILFRSTVHAVPESPEPGKPRILLVEENAGFRRWVADGLADFAAVESETSVDAALRRARETLPDLVISDDHPTGCDGVSLVQALRSSAPTSHIPVVLLSSLNVTERRIAASDAGADAYLGKPVDLRELRACANGILERHKTLRQKFREKVVFRSAEVCERSIDQRFLEKVTQTIEDSIDSTEFSVQDLGEAVSMSTSQLTRKLRALVGQGPAELIRRMRLQRAADLIAGNTGQITDICFRVGFSDHSHFSRTFKRHFGASPVEYRRQHAGSRDG